MDYYAYGELGEFDETPPKSLKTEIFEWLDVLVVSVIAVVLIFTFFFRIVTIDGESMENTLHGGERVIISDMFYTPTQGDIVVISRNVNNNLEPGQYPAPIIKRIIATAGQTVNIDFRTGTVYVDGVALEEDYTKTLATVHLDEEIDFPAYVPENCVFVLGDNRQYSLDSRSALIGKNGMVDTRYILGKAVYRLFPFKKMGGLY